ncbi:2-succinyl-5-enolpyruvyl-6-hydroxy-3-cyclohexene-1-carboxylic-acid synthase [Brevibacterium marinum]|uniref:2-succinyl-5-enolpyruvyl-6-hydroxy-3-cyclohexene-1-carboxylate synthase n=1 Tax=Brevibacterium marinum TaxID=418643 RepID=A0A846RWX2_9MICO|nr:2-succinyl-5-enolpyruvyl-6-hydroxy-3-cyclohexene-1-carboxylic-acid synthase [Brevibacterium marinum]NJC58299.1 2-succinyl-5-enolpyruvyl-6-hydroxy-3-cyclohexene-1-carboxylate synthase [Brevibacterium marinum]
MLNSSAVAHQIARELALVSVTEVVIAPGSRSAPLIYALAPLAEAGVIRTHVRIDERDAGFLALGLARGLRTRQAGPVGAVAVVTTSGSAVANLHPAVLEASYGRLPLIAITADRPARLRGTGANQTIDDQSRVLSDVRGRVDVPAGSPDADRLLAEAAAQAVGEGKGEPGPVQFNVQFDVPLVPTAEELAEWKTEVQTLGKIMMTGTKPPVVPADGPASADESASGTSAAVRILPGTVIVAGDAGGHAAESLRSLVEAKAIPVLAEPSSPLTSALRDSGAIVAAHAEVLAGRDDLRRAIRTVIVHGKPTLTRPVAALLADPEVLVQRVPDDVDAVSLSVEGAEDGAVWCREWVSAGDAIVAESRRSREASAQGQKAQPQQSSARAITEFLAGSAIELFAASSNTIRYLSEGTDVRARIHASRGLAGIDGLVSTATGLSLALGEQVVLVIGDVAMLHDAGGLLTPSAEEEGDVLIVVLNDDGGAIFSGLEHSQDHVAPYLKRYFTVPHGRDFEDLAAAYGWGYALVSELDEFIAEFGNTQVGFDSAASGAGAGRSMRRLGRRIIEVDLT